MIKEITSSGNGKSTRKRSFKSSILYLIFLSFVSCTHPSRNSEYKVPAEYEDKFPSSIVKKDCSENYYCYIVELRPKTLEVECRLRNDSPYYWCYVNAILAIPDPKFSKKISTFFHYVVDKNGAKRAGNFVKNLKSNNEPVYLVTMTGYKLGEDNKFIGQLIGLYSDSECIDLNSEFVACKDSKRKLDIYTGKYN